MTRVEDDTVETLTWSVLLWEHQLGDGDYVVRLLRLVLGHCRGSTPAQATKQTRAVSRSGRVFTLNNGNDGIPVENFLRSIDINL